MTGSAEQPAYWRVPRAWSGETVFLLGGGPSLRAVNLAPLAGRRIIAINNAYRLAPTADVLYFADQRWWFEWGHGPRVLASDVGALVTISAAIAAHEGERVRLLRNGGATGLSTAPDAVVAGRNSGYAAINLAVLFGAARVVLLGYDMRHVGGRTHWHNGHLRTAKPSTYRDVYLPRFATLVAPLAAAGVEVLNATPGSALTCFPAVELGAMV